LVGNAAPNFTVAPVKPGGDIRLADYKGKVVLLDFWATWCGPCIAIMPELGEIQKKYGDRGLAVVGVTDENATTVQKFLQSKGDLGYTLVLDRQGRTNLQFGVRSYPTTVLIGRDGKVIHYEVGVDPRAGLAELEEKIKKALDAA
jgi:thiol-disulfide isomerase/thioredoxin